MVDLDDAVLKMCDEAVQVLRTSTWDRQHVVAYDVLSAGVNYLNNMNIRIPDPVFQEFEKHKLRW